MLGVIEDQQGTGKNYRLDNGVRMIGKTGTGQVVENGGYSTSVYMHSFVGLAPYEDPQVVMFIILQIRGFLCPIYAKYSQTNNDKCFTSS